MNPLEIIGHVSNVAGAVSGIVSAVGVLFLLRDRRRLAQDVEVVLTLRAEDGSGREIALPMHLKRRDVSRPEILGRLGMVPTKARGARFALRHLSSPEFMDAINRVAEGKGSRVEILCSQEELDQFDL